MNEGLMDPEQHYIALCSSRVENWKEIYRVIGNVVWNWKITDPAGASNGLLHNRLDTILSLQFLISAA